MVNLFSCLLHFIIHYYDYYCSIKITWTEMGLILPIPKESSWCAKVTKL